jgi:transposase InsO family protein
LLLGYSRQAYYQGLKYQQKQSLEADLLVVEVLRYRAAQKRIGTRKLFNELQPFLSSHGIKMGRDALFTLLSERNLLVRQRKRRGPGTTFSRHRYKKYPNLVKEFIPLAPNQLWVSDITYIRVAEKFAYLSLVTDAYSRKIVGYCLNESLSAQGPLNALKMALASNKEHQGLIHHSDRGIQYCCDDYISLLQKGKNPITVSMTENGDPLENAIAERVNGILKGELLQEHYRDFKLAAQDIKTAISTYNHLRPHSSIGYLKPVQAHQLSGSLPRKWKNYYPINKGKEATVSI